MLNQHRGLVPFRRVILAVLILYLPFESAGDAATPDGRIAQARELWQRGDVRQRREALRRLKRLGPRAEPALPMLIEALADPDPAIRKDTALVLKRTGSGATAAAPALLEALGDPAGDVRDAAASALMTTRPNPGAAIPAIVASLRAGDGRRCTKAAGVLGRLGEPAVPVLIELLRDNDPKVREEAGLTLSRIGSVARPFIPALIEALRFPEPETAQSVVAALAGAGPEAVEPLCRALCDRDSRVRGGAACALKELGQQAAAAVPALIAALSERKPPDVSRYHIAMELAEETRQGETPPSIYQAALAAIGQRAVPALLEQLDRPEPGARVLALRALAYLKDDARGAVPRLIALLGDRGLRDEAARALGGIGPASRTVIPVLVAALKDPDPAFRARAAETLGRIGWLSPRGDDLTVASRAVAPLIGALRDEDPRVRAASVRALAEIGGSALAATPALIKLLSDPAVEVRLAVLEALPNLDELPESPAASAVKLFQDADHRVRRAAVKLIDDDALGQDEVVAGLLILLKDQAADVRAQAAFVLARTKAQEAIEVAKGIIVYGEASNAALVRSPSAGRAVRAGLSDPDPRVRAGVACALAGLKDEAGESVPLLASALKDADPFVRAAAAAALGHFGEEASPAIPALLDIVDHDRDGDESQLIWRAARALLMIGPEASTKLFDRLAARLGSSDEAIRRHAGDTFHNLGPEATPELARLLIDPERPRVARLEALRALAQEHGLSVTGQAQEPEVFGPRANEVMATLRVMIRDDEAEVRDNARNLLAALAGETDARARLFLDAAREEDWEDWETSRAALGYLDQAAVPVLVEGLRDPDEEVRTLAAEALGLLGIGLPQPDDGHGHGQPQPVFVADPDNAEEHAKGLQARSRAAEALVASLDDPDSQVRWTAAWALRFVGSGDEPVRALVRMARDRTTRVRVGARIRISTALDGSWSDQTACGELLCVSAIQGLFAFGPAAAPAVPALIDALADEDRLVRTAAALTLAEIGPAAKRAVPGLIALLQSKDQVPAFASQDSSPQERPIPERLATLAAHALGRIGPDGRAAVPALSETLADPDPGVRAAAAEALSAIGPDSRTAIPPLIRALHDPDRSVVENAAMALGEIGPAPVPALIEVFRGRDLDARLAAAQALRNIGYQASAAVPELLRALDDPDEMIRTSAAEALHGISDPPGLD